MLCWRDVRKWRALSLACVTACAPSAKSSHPAGELVVGRAPPSPVASMTAPAQRSTHDADLLPGVAPVDPMACYVRDVRRGVDVRVHPEGLPEMRIRLHHAPMRVKIGSGDRLEVTLE